MARRQLDAEMPEPGTTQTEGATPRASPTGSTTGAGPEAAVPRLAQRFYGTVSLHPARVERDAGRIADEVIFHLTALVGSEVKVALEIEAQVPTVFPKTP